MHAWVPIVAGIHSRAHALPVPCLHATRSTGRGVRLLHLLPSAGWPPPHERLPQRARGHRHLPRVPAHHAAAAKDLCECTAGRAMPAAYVASARLRIGPLIHSSMEYVRACDAYDAYEHPALLGYAPMAGCTHQGQARVKQLRIDRVSVLCWWRCRRRTTAQGNRCRNWLRRSACCHSGTCMAVHAPLPC